MWYLGITTSRLIRPKPGAEKIRGEFAVEHQLCEIGIDAIAPKRVDFIRKGKNRFPEPEISPYLRGYIFADIPAERFTEAIQAQGLSSSLMAITPQEMRCHVYPFLERAKQEEQEAQRIIARRDRAAMCQFQAGQAVDVLSGPFQDRTLSFVRMVHSATGQFPEIECEGDLFGRKVKIRVDPLDVRSA